MSLVFLADRYAYRTRKMNQVIRGNLPWGRLEVTALTNEKARGISVRNIARLLLKLSDGSIQSTKCPAIAVIKRIAATTISAS